MIRKTTIFLIIAVVLIALTVPVLAEEHGTTPPKFGVSDIIQRKIPPPNNAYWKVWKFNTTTGNYLLEPVRPVDWYPYWTPLGKRIWMTYRFVDPRFIKKGTCGYPLIQAQTTERPWVIDGDETNVQQM